MLSCWNSTDAEAMRRRARLRREQHQPRALHDFAVCACLVAFGTLLALVLR